MRIAVGGFLHESHSFAPRPAAYGDFVRPGSSAPLTVGAAMLAAVEGAANAIAGAIAVAREAEAAIVPLVWASANPSGPVQDEAFERIAALLGATLSQALDEGPIDAVFLDLHGAGLTDGFPDLEGEVLRRVRRIVGGTPIVATLDPHANLTALMVEASDALCPYRTYPHVDMRETGARAMRLLLARATGAAPYAKAFRQLDYWMPITGQCTLIEPMCEVMAERARIAADQGVAELAFCFGFPYADFADCGPAVVAYATEPGAAAAAADALMAVLVRREGAFVPNILPAEVAVAEALREAGSGLGSGPVVIADTQDNPGGGGHGDTTGLLAELVAQGADAVLCLINDADSATDCAAAGVGATLDLSLGGRSDGAPLACRAHVLRLTDGRFVCTGPMAGGNPADLGPTALVEIGGVRVIVVSRKMQALDQAILRHVGIEPAECRILALKSSVHFRADFGPIARRVIVAEAPGPVTADPSTLPFRHVRSRVRRRPGTAA